MHVRNEACKKSIFPVFKKCSGGRCTVCARR